MRPKFFGRLCSVVLKYWNLLILDAVRVWLGRLQNWSRGVG